MLAPTLPLDATISLLIVKDHKWNESLVGQQLMPEDVDQILKIALPRCPRLDQLLWGFHKHGDYSVKSGYRVAFGLRISYCPGPSKRSHSE